MQKFQPQLQPRTKSKLLNRKMYALLGSFSKESCITSNMGNTQRKKYFRIGVAVRHVKIKNK